MYNSACVCMYVCVCCIVYMLYIYSERERESFILLSLVATRTLNQDQRAQCYGSKERSSVRLRYPMCGDPSEAATGPMQCRGLNS